MYFISIIDKKDEKELEEYIRNVSLVLGPNHYLLLEAKQRLAGVLRDTINREPRPTKKLMKRKMELCEEILNVLNKLCPGISRTKGSPMIQNILKGKYVTDHNKTNFDIIHFSNHIVRITLCDSALSEKTF